MLKNNLRSTIKVGKNEFNSISEALNEDYARSKVYGQGYGLATYRGKIIVLDIASELHDPNDKKFDDFYECESLWSNLYKQIDTINEELDGE
jgi:hypothetical protein